MNALINAIALCGYFMILSHASMGQALDSVFQQTPYIELDHLPICDQLEVDNELNIYLLSREELRIYKYLNITHYDSSIVIGGQSQREEGLSNPAKLDLNNRQSLYVLDDIARRIILLNTNFQLVRQLDFLDVDPTLIRFEEQQDLFPQSFCLNTVGEIFVLNQLDNRVLKMNLFGEIETIFAGTNYGEGSLFQPVDIQATIDNLIFVSDIKQQKITVFNNFGTFQSNIRPKGVIKWNSFHIFENYLICFNERQILIQNLLDNSFQESTFPQGVLVKDVYVNRQFIYLLMENAVLLYNFK